MKKFIFLILFTLSKICFAQFLPYTNDVPLIEGMTLLPNEVSFDSPEGHIIVLQAQTKTLTKAQINSFYQETLTSLGWTFQGNHFFTREKDNLQISYIKEKPFLKIQFNITLENSY